VNVSARQLLPERATRLPDLPPSQELDRGLRRASPAGVIAVALRAVGR